MSQLAFDISKVSRTGIKEKEKMDVLTGGRYTENLNEQRLFYLQKSIFSRHYIRQKWRREVEITELAVKYYTRTAEFTRKDGVYATRRGLSRDK